MRPGALALALGMLVALVTLVVGGPAACSLIVDGELGVVSCSDDGAVGPPACPDGYVCTTGVCVESAASRFGAPCASDDACAPLERCVDLITGGPIASSNSSSGSGYDAPDAGPLAPGRLGCTRRCCSSADCGDPSGGFVCGSVEPDGSRLCRPAEALGRARPGAGPIGDVCETGDACRSGVCGDAGACLDACCTVTNCTVDGSTCRLATTSEATVAGAGLVCAPARGDAKGRLKPCVNDADCASGLCEKIEGLGPVCVEPCCSSTSCGSADLPLSGQHALTCRSVARGGASVRACVGLARAQATKPAGAPCSDETECRSGACVPGPPSANGAPGPNFCTDACCTDASCGDESLVCVAPGPAEPSGPLRCVRR